MWSSSAFVCPTAEADGSSIHSIAQYIEDYIDLVENVPNEVIRQITVLHEHNHRYQQLLTNLELKWDSVVNDESEVSRKRSLLAIQRCLIEIQEISDEKLFIIQSVLDQLDSKARQLDFDYRSTTSSAVNSVSSSPTKSNAVTVNSCVNNAIASSSCSDTLNSANNSDNVQTSGEMNSNKDSCSLNNSTPTATSPTNNSTSHASLNNKRSSRRSLNSGKNNDNGNNGELSTTGKRGLKRGVKAHNKDVKRNKGKDLAGNSPPMYDDTPIDPDEPTYCLCEQVSFGEMICCDNDACTIEWFHFSCVALTTKPKGRWYCPNCRGDRSNIPKK